MFKELLLETKKPFEQASLLAKALTKTVGKPFQAFNDAYSAKVRVPPRVRGWKNDAHAIIIKAIKNSSDLEYLGLNYGGALMVIFKHNGKQYRIIVHENVKDGLTIEEDNTPDEYILKDFKSAIDYYKSQGF
jgi:hypothetical protein